MTRSSGVTRQRKEIEFVGRSGQTVGVKFNPRGEPGQQTPRSIRQTTERTALLFDELLDATGRL